MAYKFSARLVPAGMQGKILSIIPKKFRYNIKLKEFEMPTQNLDAAKLKAQELCPPGYVVKACWRSWSGRQ